MTNISNNQSDYQRNSTIVYRSFYEAIVELPEANQVEVWKALFEYALNFNEIPLKGLSKTIFTLIKPQLDANNQKYLNGIKPKKKQKGSKKEPNIKEEESEQEANENANENGNENANENVNNLLLSEIDVSDVPNGLKFYYDVAISFQQLFIKNLTTLKSPTKQLQNVKFKNFIDPIRLAFEKGEINKGEIKDAYDFLNSQDGSWWWPVILTTKKLIEKLPQLVAQKNSQQSKIKNDGSTNPRENKVGRTSKLIAEDFADFPVIVN